MSSQLTPRRPRQIVWPSVVTVVSAAILIGAEVFGAAFAGGWALAILLGLDVLAFVAAVEQEFLNTVGHSTLPNGPATDAFKNDLG